MKQSSNLLSYSLDSDFSTSCIGKSQPKNMHMSQHGTIFGWLESIHGNNMLGNNLTDNAIKHKCIWWLVWCNKYKRYNSSTPLQQFLPFFVYQSKVNKKGERTHHSAMNKSWSEQQIYVSASIFYIVRKKLVLASHC